MGRKVLELMKKLAKEEEGEDDDEEKEDGDDEKKEGKEAEKTDEEKKDKKEEDEKSWMKFWKEFNKNLKMGCYEDDSNRSKLSKLLRFTTTKSEGKEISLDKYLDRMQESQESIYYMSGESIDVMKKALEVLMLSDHLDEPCLQKLADYEGKKFVSIQKADVKLDETEEEKKRFSKVKDMYKPLTDWWKDKLTDFTEKGAMKDAGVKVEAVSISKRLTESPVVVVTSQFGYSAQQEKIMKAQAFQNKDQIGMMSGRKTLEVNPNHPVIVDLLAKVKANKEDSSALDTAQVLFQTALIQSGYDIADPSALVNRVYRLMSKELGVDPDAPLKEIEVPEEEEEAEEDDKEDGDEADENDEEDEKKEDL